MDNFYGPLSVRITGFDCNETYDTIFELGKIGVREGRYKKGKGVSCYVAPALITGDLLPCMNFTV